MDLSMDSSSSEGSSTISEIFPTEILNSENFNPEDFINLFPDTDTETIISSNPSSETEFEEQVERFLSELNITDEDEEYRIQTVHINNLENYAEYKLYKPKVEQSLYFVMMRRAVEEKELKELAQMWIQYYRQENGIERAFYLLYQLVLDIMGYQKVQIINEKHKLDENFSHFKTILEISKPTMLHQQLKFILKENNKCCETIKVVYFKFLSEWFRACCDDNIVCDKLFGDMLIKFVGTLITSNFFLIKFNILVFVSKMITNITLALFEIDDDSRKKRKLNLLLDSMNGYFWRELMNCMRDSRMSKMKLIVMFEMYKWICHNPSYFIKKPLGKSLKLLICDSNSMVRLKAIKLSLLVLEAENTEHNFTKNLSHIIGTRFLDKNPEVRLNSIEYFINLARKSPNDVPNFVKKNIQLGIGATNYELAVKCALYNKIFLELTPNNTFTKVFQLASVKELVKRRKLVIPACISACPELRNVEPLLKRIISMDIEVDDLNTCMEILYYIAKYLLTAENDFEPRRPFRENIAENHKLFTDSFLSYTVPMLTNLNNNPTSLHWLLKTVNFIDFKEIRTAINNAHVSNLITALIKLLSKIKNNETIKLAGQVIAKIKEGPLGPVARSLLDRLTRVCFDNFGIIIDKLILQHLSDEEYSQYIIDLRLISNLYKYHDFGDKIDFNKMPLNWGIDEIRHTQSDMLLIKYQLSLCRWYLIWNLKNIFKEEEFEVLLPDFHKKVKVFYCYCSKVLTTHASHATKLAAFFQLSKFLIATLDHLIAIKSKHRQDILVDCPLNQTLRDEIIKFVDQVCFKVRRGNRETEELILAHYFGVLVQNWIEFKHVVNILKYHVDFKNDYSRVYDQMFGFMISHRDPSKILPSVTLLTLIDSFTEKQRDDIEYVQQLSCELFQYIPRNILGTFVEMAIGYAINFPENASFLHVLKPYVIKLNQRDRKNCLEKTKRLIKIRNLGESVPVLHFKSYLEKPNDSEEWGERIDVSTINSTSTV